MATIPQVLPASAEVSAPDTAAPGATRVLSLSTISFTLMFAVWLMFGVLGVPIQKEFDLTKSQFYWLTAIAILNGSIWRLPFGIAAERYGGRNVTLILMVWGAITCAMTSFATSYSQLMVFAFLLGIVGNSFTVGIAWNSAWFSKDRQGVALGTFGAGNVGASVTKLIGPALITLVPVGGILGGVIPGGWRFVPILYSILLLIMAAVLWRYSPPVDRRPGQGRSIKEMLKPIAQLRVWCFGLYYVVVFGAYVALSLVLPNYYKMNYGLELSSGALLATLFVFPASLLRPLGGWMSDKFGAGRVTYGVFIGMLGATLPLALPQGAMGFEIGVTSFTVLVVLIGVGMGIGKASAYKFIAELYPRDVGATGGLMGTLGALGGFAIPLLAGAIEEVTGAPNAIFFLLLLLIGSSFLWLHLVVSGRERLVSEHLLPMAVGAAFFIAVWIAVGAFSNKFPGPVATFTLGTRFLRDHFWGDAAQPGIPQLLFFSLGRAGLGLLAALVVAVPLGFLLGASRFAGQAARPIIAFLRPISPLAWYPVAMVLFTSPGTSPDSTSRTLAIVFVVFLCCLWPLALQISQGVRRVDKRFLEFGRMLGMSPLTQVARIYIPAILPNLLSGLRGALGLAWMVIVSAEMLSGQDGIGRFCWNQYQAGAIENTLMGVAIVGTVGVAMNGGLALLERRAGRAA